MIEIKLNKLWLNYTWNNYNFTCNIICFVYVVLSDSLKSVSNTKLNKYDDTTEYVPSEIGFKKEKVKGERTVNWKLPSQCSKFKSKFKSKVKTQTQTCASTTPSEAL